MKDTKGFWKSKTTFSTALLFLSLFILTINFQNCSSNLSSANFGDDDVATGTTGSVVDDLIPITNTDSDSGLTPATGLTGLEPGLTASFLAGDAFSGQTLVSSTSYLDTQVSRFSYVSYGLGKAIAVASSGLGYAALTDGSNTEAERVAIESCNLLTGESCALIVSGNSFAISSTDVDVNLEYRLDGFTGRSFQASEIPLASASNRNSSMVSNFVNASGNKALALSITGALYVAFTTGLSLSEADVSRMAIQRCELESAITPCILYAVNTRVEFNPRAWRKGSSINFTNNDVLAVAPPASRATSLVAIEELLDQLASNERYGIAITPNGFGYFGRHATDTAEAEAEALRQCEAGVHGTRCIDYASSRGVNISSDDMLSKQNFSSLFCRGVRDSCASHRAVGCTDNGEFWTQDPSSLRAVRSLCQ